MPRKRSPRKGSMQYWPRKRAGRVYARVRYWKKIKEAKPLGFAGYKVGMTHVIIIDNRKFSKTKGEEISCPVTVIECPPIKTISIRFYKNTKNGLRLVSEIFSEKLDKELERRIILPKKIKKKIEDIKDYDDIRLLACTQPKLTGIGKKKPTIFEIFLGGKKEEKLKYAKEKLGKEIVLEDVFKEGQQVDAHVITKAKGFQGPVKRFGIGLKHHKSEKSNKWLIKIGKTADEINVKGGFLRFGLVKNPYVLVKGSVGGPVKRLVRFNYATRENKNIPTEAPVIQYTSLKQ